MRSKARSLTVSVLALTILSSCAASGPVPLAESPVILPAIPADLKICFDRKVPPPAPGPKTKRELFKLIADLKGSADDKDRCGHRLVCWFDDVARGFAGIEPKAALDPACGKS